METFVIVTIILALIFDFINGFHDSANAIATVVATKVLSPLKAVTMAAVFNLIGPLVFGTAIASMIGTGIIDTKIITVNLIFATLIGAIVWDLITWYLALPTSSSHALVGGLVGAGIAASSGTANVNASGVEKIVLFMVISPIIGLVAAFIFALLIMRTFRKMHPSRINIYFKKLQLFSAAFYSLTHGTNDAQKTMGVIAILLVAEASNPIGQTHLSIPFWVIVSCAAAIGLGTFFGGWRIVKTMAQRVTRLRPYQGFCAETSSGIVLASMASLGIPVSTTHVISSSIMGVGATDKLSAVRWGIARKIVGAWILTIPMAALISASVFLVMKAMF